MILELPVLVVLDEAYIEFHGIEHSLVCEVPRRQNLIVLRTFSKRAALAGDIFLQLLFAEILFCLFVVQVYVLDMVSFQ